MSSSKKHTCAKHNKREILENIDALIYCNIPDIYRECIAEEYEFKKWTDKTGQQKVKIVGWDCPIQKLTCISDIITDLCKHLNEKIGDNEKLTDLCKHLNEKIRDNKKLTEENENCKSQFNEYLKINKLEKDYSHFLIANKYDN